MKFVLWKYFRIQKPNLKSSLNEHLFIYGEISLVGDPKKTAITLQGIFGENFPILFIVYSLISWFHSFHMSPMLFVITSHFIPHYLSKVILF